MQVNIKLKIQIYILENKRASNLSKSKNLHAHFKLEK